VIVALAACGGPLDKNQLYGEVEDVRALAAESRLLFEKDVPRPFFDVHRQMLADKVDEALEKLARGVKDDALEPDRQNAYALARALEPIVRGGEDPNAIVPIEHLLAGIQTRLSP
jgi:hypothetical protein